MGIRDLKHLLERYAEQAAIPVTIKDVRGKTFAIDANIFMYRFMAAKEHYDGRHVERFRRFVAWMRLHDIEPIFVFDGDSPEEKKRELKARREQKKKATTHLKDLQQGVVVLQHLDWRWWQLTVVLRAVALIGSPRLPPPLPVTVAALGDEDSCEDNNLHHDGSNSRERAFEEPNVALGALFQLLAETLEWGTETYLPNRLVQNLVDKSFLVHELPRDQLPALIRFVAQIRLRRHTPHMVELDWMHDPSKAVTAVTSSCHDESSCSNKEEQDGNFMNKGPPFDTYASMGNDTAITTTTRLSYASVTNSSSHTVTGTRHVHNRPPFPPPVIIGGDEDDIEVLVGKENEDAMDVVNNKLCNCATAFSCRAMTEDVLETLLMESLNKQTKSKDIFRPFLVCIHVTRNVARDLYKLIRQFRRRLDAAWNSPSDYTFLIALVAHDGPDKDAEWLFPSQSRADILIRQWQENLPWPTKNQEKAAKGANFDYYDWIGSARSSEWWYEMLEQCTAAMKTIDGDEDKDNYGNDDANDKNKNKNKDKNKDNNECLFLSETVQNQTDFAWDDETLDGDALTMARWPMTTDWLDKCTRRTICRHECNLYTCAAATLTNPGPQITTSKAAKKRSKHTISLETEWDTFRAEQQKKRLEALESVQSEYTEAEEAATEREADTEADETEAEEDREDKKPQDNKAIVLRPTKQRLQCLESPERRTMLVKQMKQKIATLEPQVTRVTGEQLEEVYAVLKSLGTLVITAEHEAEATCARLVRAGYADWVVTEDFDAMPFGAPKMLRRLLWSAAVLDGEDAENPEESKPLQRLPNDFEVGELIDLNRTLRALRMSAREFVDLCIICGCDFCKGIQGVGYVVAQDLIRKHGNLETIVRRLGGRNGNNSSRYAKGLSQFNLDNAIKARKLFMDNHTDVLPEVVKQQLQIK